jgi:hypothetical protein
MSVLKSLYSDCVHMWNVELMSHRRIYASYENKLCDVFPVLWSVLEVIGTLIYNLELLVLRLNLLSTNPVHL